MTTTKSNSSTGEQETGEQILVELISGVEGQCIGVNDYRVCGPKPWGGGTIERTWKTTKRDVLAAFLTPDEKHQWLAMDLTVVPVNSYTELERERDALKRILNPIVACYGLGLPADKFANQIAPWIEEARAALGESK